MTHSNLTDQIKTAATTMEFAACEECSSQQVVRLPNDWQEQSAIVPIVACGNPWHYTETSLFDKVTNG